VLDQPLGLLHHHLGDLARGVSPARRTVDDTTSPRTERCISGALPPGRSSISSTMRITFRMIGR
jgi:hypothetical protein